MRGDETDEIKCGKEAGRAETEGCKAIFGGDKGRERLREICLIGPVRTGWRDQMRKKKHIQMENGLGS